MSASAVVEGKDHGHCKSTDAVEGWVPHFEIEGSKGPLLGGHGESLRERSPGRAI